MALTLYYHPLSSYCWKVLVALYENGTSFEPHVVDLGDTAARAEFKKLSPFAKFPVVRDEARGETVAESSIIIEYIGLHYPGPVALVPADGRAALGARALDRFYDLYVHGPMQKIVGDKLRPADKKDPFGVEEARGVLETAYAEIEKGIAGKTWATGDAFTLADCSASPALYYANRVQPLTAYPNTAVYLERLLKRPSFARVFAEAQPYLHHFPG